VAANALSLKVPREALEYGLRLEFEVVDPGGVLSLQELRAPRGFLPADMNGHPRAGQNGRAGRTDTEVFAAPRGFLP
jgi:hypothetical protein